MAGKNPDWIELHLVTGLKVYRRKTVIEGFHAEEDGYTAVMIHGNSVEVRNTLTELIEELGAGGAVGE